MPRAQEAAREGGRERATATRSQGRLPTRPRAIKPSPAPAVHPAMRLPPQPAQPHLHRTHTPPHVTPPAQATARHGEPPAASRGSRCRRGQRASHAQLQTQAGKWMGRNLAPHTTTASTGKKRCQTPRDGSKQVVPGREQGSERQGGQDASRTSSMQGRGGGPGLACGARRARRRPRLRKGPCHPAPPSLSAHRAGTRRPKHARGRRRSNAT